MGLRKLFGLERRSSKESAHSIREPLNEPDALDQIAQIRQYSTTLPRLRERLTLELADKRCLIIGSAPGSATIPPHDKCICVNGSGRVATDLGIDRPDLTLIVGWTLRNDSKVRIGTVEVLRNLRTKTLLFLQSGFTTPEALRILESANFRYDEFIQISSLERAVIIGDICGEDIATGKGSRDRRPSNGIFASALALWAGAKFVTLTGFSFKGGHAYINGDTPRYHVEGDQWFLQRTARQPIDIV